MTCQHCQHCQHWGRAPEYKIVNKHLDLGVCRLTLVAIEGGKLRFGNSNAIAVMMTYASGHLPDVITQLETFPDFGCNQFEAVSK